MSKVDDARGVVLAVGSDDGSAAAKIDALISGSAAAVAFSNSDVGSWLVALDDKKNLSMMSPMLPGSKENNDRKCRFSEMIPGKYVLAKNPMFPARDALSLLVARVVDAAVSGVGAYPGSRIAKFANKDAAASAAVLAVARVVDNVKKG